jgi:hypothetical protein
VKTCCASCATWRPSTPRCATPPCWSRPTPSPTSWISIDFLATADRALAELDLEGILQIAPFHPRFVFAGTRDDDITNYTNRTPYPTLHLIRETSIDRAVQAFPEAEAIFEVNMATMEKLGPEGWAALDVGPTLDAGDCGKLKP